MTDATRARWAAKYAAHLAKVKAKTGKVQVDPTQLVSDVGFDSPYYRRLRDAGDPDNYLGSLCYIAAEEIRKAGYEPA